jgi:ABC-type sugar transport system ATPase subunit
MSLCYFRLMVLLQVQELGKKNIRGWAVQQLSFIQQQGEKIAIAGETGSGKTTLLKMIGGLLQPDAGTILFNGSKVAGPLEQLIPGHPQIAYLSQHFELRNNYWVYELLEMTNQLSEEEAGKLYSVCQIDHLLHRRTNELSGGEKQRIVLAMQLIKKPALLLLDEPFSNLDAIHEQTIKQVLHDVNEHYNTSCILVSHDGKDVLSWADTIYIMQNGQIVQSGTPQQIYNTPLNEYCAGLFGAYNYLPSSIFYGEGNENIFIRPEQLSITHNKENAVKAVIDAVYYYGSYYTVHAKANGYLLQITSPLNSWQSGDEVYVTLTKK